MTYIIEDNENKYCAGHEGPTYRGGIYAYTPWRPKLAADVSRCWSCGTPESEDADRRWCAEASEWDSKEAHNWYVPGE